MLKYGLDEKEVWGKRFKILIEYEIDEKENKRTVEWETAYLAWLQNNEKKVAELLRNKKTFRAKLPVRHSAMGK